MFSITFWVSPQCNTPVRKAWSQSFYMFSITFWVSPQCDTHLHVKNKLKEKKRNILLRTSETEQKKGRKYSRMFSRLSLFGHVWCVEGVSNYTCLCAGCRQILGARFMSDISIVEEGFLVHRHHESACPVCPNNSVCSF